MITNTFSLTKMQILSLESEYILYVTLGNYEAVKGLEYALGVINEHDLRDHLVNTYRIQ